jgi:hypothetical protein
MGLSIPNTEDHGLALPSLAANQFRATSATSFQPLSMVMPGAARRRRSFHGTSALDPVVDE